MRRIMERQRTIAQDAAKGLMIIGVVFFHCYLVTATNPQQLLMTFNPLTACFPFLLSSFFFYAGYNYQPSERTFKQLVIRRAKQLLIPLVLSFIISTIIISSFYLIGYHEDVEASFQAIGNSILYSLMSEPMAIMLNFPQSGGVVFELVVALGLQWFLYTLFICSVFFYLLVKHTNRKFRHFISVIVGLLLLSFIMGQFVGTYLPYLVEVYPLVIAIMLTGAYLRKSHFLNRWPKTKKKFFFILLNMVIAEGLIVGSCFLCNYLFGSIFTGSIPGGQFDPVLRGFDVIFAYFFGILGTYFIHTLCRIIKHVPYAGKALQWVGVHSAIFYLFHPIFIAILSILIFKNQVPWGDFQAYFYTFVTIACLILLSFGIDFIANKKSVTREAIEEIQNNKDREDIHYDDD